MGITEFVSVNDSVLVELNPMGIKPHGIVGYNINTEEFHAGKVVSVGQGHRNADSSFSKLSVKVGDVVVFPATAVKSFMNCLTVSYVAVHESDIVATHNEGH